MKGAIKFICDPYLADLGTLDVARELNHREDVACNPG